MDTSSLLDIFSKGHSELIDRLASLTDRCALRGLAGSSRALLLGLLSQRRPVLCIMDDQDDAGYLYADLCQLLGEDDVLYFPSSYRRAIKYGHIDEGNLLLRSMLVSRLGAIQASSQVRPPIIISYPEAIVESLSHTEGHDKQQLTLNRGQRYAQSDLVKQLLEWGFDRVDYVYTPGQFAIRGGIFDVYSYSDAYPYRIDFFGDEIDSLRSFTTQDQLSRRQLDYITITPNISQGDGTGGVPLISLLPQEYLVYMRSAQDLIERWEHIWRDEPHINDGEGFDTIEEIQKLLVSPTLLQELLDSFAQIAYSSKPGVPIYDLDTTALTFAPKGYTMLCRQLVDWDIEGKTVLLSAKTQGQYDHVCEIIRQHDIHAPLPQRLPSTLHESFLDNSSQLVLLTEHEIFGRFHKYQLQNDQVRNARLSLSLKDLQTFSLGDLITHSEHGIGRFGGIASIDIGGRKQEAVLLYYDNGDSIFVNLHSLHKLSLYRTKENSEGVRLSTLGSGSWQRLKEKTKKRVKDIARELIALYAKRRETPGFAFSTDSYLQHELEASFMYEYTLDQKTAIEDVKADMEKPYPMDRLLCGDVGFGKTEVSMQAAFKAVCDNKQVAVLVPTTVLAHQHYQTYTKRLREMPVRIEYLSRARSRKETQQILKDLENGAIDIIIGTHRLTSKDVKFKDLGLLVIDEEQRFGVAVKEKLRRLQVNVDTLTMSATPIPRTLQFSLMGARDLTNLKTAPPNRRPIETILTRQSGEIIAEAINFEMSRNGQVYFIHNRIEDLEGLANLIKKHVPDARIAIGHGQVSPVELEQTLLDFGNYEYDVLIATTIVENGIDVPNANTIIINDAHRYGLAALHQLRGRVGRSNEKAYCYLFTPPLSVLSSEAQRRVKAIESFCELGSGIRIALQDLDIRGAGNVLGAEQSGFIANMGYETYQKVFNEAVRELKRDEYSTLFSEELAKQADEDIDTTIETDLEISLPSNYIPGDSERIFLYRELDKLSMPDDIREYRSKLIDRFGNLPEQAEELIRVPLLRGIGRRLGIDKLILRNDTMTLYFDEGRGAEFFQSNKFGGILQYVVKHQRNCELNTRNGKHIVRIKSITSVAAAIVVANEMLEHAESTEQ